MKRSDNKSKNASADSSLRSLLKSNALQAPPSPWFTRKVMNRLPEKRVHTLARIEYTLYMMAAIFTIIYSVIYVKGVWASGVITVGNISVMAICIGLLCSIAFLMIEPWFSDDTSAA